MNFPVQLNPDESISKLYMLDMFRMYDPDVVELEASAHHCTLYDFRDDSNVLERLGVEGPTFVVRRRCAPFYRLVVLNKKAHMNFLMDVDTILNSKLEKPYLFLKYKNKDESNGDGAHFCVRGLWSAVEDDQRKLRDALSRIIKARKAESRVHGASQASLDEQSRSSSLGLQGVNVTDMSEGKSIFVSPKMMRAAKESLMQAQSSPSKVQS